MNISLQNKVTILITLVILVISVISTTIFTTAHRESKEKGRIARGTALSFALSHAAAEGLIHEDLDLLQKASAVVTAPDVTLSQVYSSIWEPLDAYPISRLKDQPNAEAMAHFKKSNESFFVKSEEGYDFYSPILFSVIEGISPSSIGFVRVTLSSVTIQKELRQVVLVNAGVSFFITLLAIISLNMLVRSMVLSPVMSLYKSMSLFRKGIMPEESSVSESSANELKELSLEFNRMCRTVKEKEEKLIESEQRLRLLFERVEHAIFRLDSNGNITETNNRFTEMFGEKNEFCDILIGDSNTSECLRRAVSENGLHAEERAVGRNGEELIISLSLYPEMDSRGNITGYVGYVIDSTEKKRMQERLTRAQKMEAVGTLAGGMAHDFNNLLTAILGYSEIILSMTQEGDPFHKPATVIHDAAQRGADFGKKILAITRKDKAEVKPININETIVSTLELLQRSIPKQIDISTKLMENMPNIKADPSQIQQVIMNLAVNAADAMPQGGRLLIETEFVGTEDRLVAGFEGGRYGFIRLSVSDTGMGIDRETQSRIFDPFYTTKHLGKGTGLGLYIVHSIVTNHGGYINLYSEPRQGTRFNIYLPVTHEESGDTATAEKHIMRGSETILIIDDERDVRELCKDMLEPLGYAVLTAEDGVSGIRIFRESKNRISLVILDMIMPKMNGSEVFTALRNISSEVRVLLCSGYSQDGFAGIDALLQQGAAGFIQKPFTRAAVTQAIKKIISGKTP